MRKLLIITSLIFSAHFAKAQVFVSKSCDITFFSEAPLENIEAKNTIAKPILNTANNEVAVRVPIKGFTFEKALMQEHFNENYMQTGTYPYATFKGKINETVDFSKDGTYKVTIPGKLEIHGVEKDRTIEATLVKKGDEIKIQSTFFVNPTDHNIEIPKVVFQKISDKIKVSLNAVMIPYKK